MLINSVIHKRTALINILLIILLPFLIYLGYKEGIWSMWIFLIFVFPFVVRNAYKYFFDVEFRKDLNKYHDDQKALPRKERERYGMYNFGIKLSLYGLALTILMMVILSFFKLL